MLELITGVVIALVALGAVREPLVRKQAAFPRGAVPSIDDEEDAID